ncbi:hypothetical protein TSUD_258800 [Trifolium subterraneum]|uniref:NAD-dependent epimerase/dehydratase domain-containing protein n=1 Tax=Trifolium subterraneum TaxID=3900 RepID=A0A2Z6NID5_TRISU|nr:hypothetical protein TSUD_258800 [Trifolium subterraneum]
MIMAISESANKKVCVTGAGGFVASWLVKLLLSKGYIVHGAVRQLGTGSRKYEHLLKLERASENLKLFEADILNYESVYKAIVGCSSVFHVATAVPSTVVSNPEVEVIEPAVKGTANVLEASLKAKVERVVFVSSASSVAINPNFPKDKVLDESCWSDKEYYKKIKSWYCYAKTEAEEQALNFAKRTGLDVVSICPTLVLGPVLQSTTNASSLFLIDLLKGCDTLENEHRRINRIVDVRDVADAILLAYENHEAEGRYICTSHAITDRDLVEKLKSIFPNYKYPTNYIELDDYRMMSSEKLQSLGWKFRQLEETLIDSVESYKEAGLL